MFRLVYISAESYPFSQTDLQTLLAKSQAKNLKLGITGLLLHKTGNFLQVLEGSEVAVTHLFAEISEDSRHRRVIVLVKETTEIREFEHWAMAYHDSDLESPLPSHELLDSVLAENIRRYLGVFQRSTQ